MHPTPRVWPFTGESRRFRQRAFAAVVAFAVVFALSTRAEAVDAAWYASSGVPPDSACPAWTTSVGDSVPLLTLGSLRISTSLCSKNTYYLQPDSSLQIGDSVVVEARLRFGSGAECLGPCGHYRTAASIAITTAPQVGTLFFVGNNEIFVTNGQCNGIISAPVPTTASAHTYRIVVSNTGVVTVYYDGIPTLSGHTYTSTSDHGSAPRISWGEGSSFAYGSSHWEFVRHNSHKTGCVPTAVDESATSAPRLSAVPNPFRTRTTLSYAVTRPARVRIDIYDATGRWVRRLVDADSTPGDHVATWDGRDAAGAAVRPGEYHYRIATSDGESAGRILRLP